MKYSEKELELAKKYVNGDYNEIQLNYIISTNNLNKKNVDLLISFCRTYAPFATFCWVVVLFYIFHLVFCFMYSWNNF